MLYVMLILSCIINFLISVVWTAVAELEAEEKERTKEEETEMDHRKNRRRQRRRAQHEEEEEQVEEEVLPFCNIKFVSSTHGGSSSSQFDEIGIPIVGDYMPLEELGLYKYHIDIGGGGGTTWEGLRTKLPLPGLLFHHVTPTKDYLHDKLKPWEHYVPSECLMLDANLQCYVCFYSLT